MPAPFQSLEDQFWSKVSPEPNSGCWLWTGASDPLGYGRINVKARLQLAHRVSYILFRGPIPDGLQLDHLCRIPCCVNPDHLEPVTPRENIMRGVGPANTRKRLLARTHCKRGHPFAGENLIHDSNAPQFRVCRECRRIRHRREYLDARGK